jgi:Xaa-Pro dipeptidase
VEQPVYSVPEKELLRRISRLQQRLNEKDLQAALIVQNTDLFYFSGTSQQAWLYVPHSGTALLMVAKDYARACSESPLTEIVSLTSPRKIPEVLSEYGYRQPEKLGMELDVLPANLFFFYNTIFTDCTIADISTEIRLIRAVKSPFELEKIRAAAKLSDQLAAYVTQCLEVGKSEVALAGELEGYARSLGHQGLVRMRMFNNELFYGHLMCGEAAAVPSYLASPTGGQGVSAVIGQGAGYRKIAANEPVLVDYVFALDGYLSDHARIFSIGSLDERLVDAHEAMVALQDEVKNLARPGVVSGEIYQEMIEIAEKRGYGDNFMGVGERRIRFTGHGVGLELDEFPFIAHGQKLPLEEGMVIALEPKTIFPAIGVVGIENTHLVTRDGLEPLTCYPDGITVIGG